MDWVWEDENTYPAEDPPDFHLFGKWQFGPCHHSELAVSLETSAQDWDRDQELSFYCGQGRKWGEEGVTISSVSSVVTSPWPGGIRCPASWLTGLVTTLPSPSASPAPSLAGIHICRENICGAEREARGRMRPPGGNGEPGEESRGEWVSNFYYGARQQSAAVRGDDPWPVMTTTAWPESSKSGSH